MQKFDGSVFLNLKPFSFFTSIWLGFFLETIEVSYIMMRIVISILAGNLNSGHSYVMTAVPSKIFFYMKQSMHLVEISIFLLNNVNVKITKIMNNLLKHLKILTLSKSFFGVGNWLNHSKKILENIGLGDHLLLRHISIFFSSTLSSKNVAKFCLLCS